MTDLMADFFDVNKHPMVNRASFPKFVKVEGREALKLHVIDLREQPSQEMF